MGINGIRYTKMIVDYDINSMMYYGINPCREIPQPRKQSTWMRIINRDELLMEHFNFPSVTLYFRNWWSSSQKDISVRAQICLWCKENRASITASGPKQVDNSIKIYFTDKQQQLAFYLLFPVDKYKIKE